MEINDRSALNAPELVLSDRTSEQIDYDAAGEVAHARLFLVGLKEIDPRLDLVYAKPNSTLLQGGYWYIVRRNDDAPPAFWVVQNDDGSPCAPDERHLQRMHEMDTARNGGYEAFNRGRDEAKKKAERERVETHREFREKLDEKLAHLYGSKSVYLPDHIVDRLKRESKIATDDPVVGGPELPLPTPKQEPADGPL